jgi:hypothetical protein
MDLAWAQSANARISAKLTILLGLLLGGPHNKIAPNRLHCFALVVLKSGLILG